MATVDEKAPTPPTEDVEKDSLPRKHADPKIVEHSHDADEAMKAFAGIDADAITIDEETNKRLLKIIDWHMMPLMCIVYGMNYLDSTNARIATTRVFDPF